MVGMAVRKNRYVDTFPARSLLNIRVKELTDTMDYYAIKGAYEVSPKKKEKKGKKVMF